LRSEIHFTGDNRVMNRRLEELVGAHLNLVYTAALRQVRDPATAEDVTQTVFLIAAKKAVGLPAHRVAAWLITVTRYASLDAMRKERRRRIHERAAAIQSVQAMQTPPRDDLLESHLDEALTALGESDRQIIVLRYFQSQSMEEVAAQLRISANTASKRLQRATERLRGHFRRRGVHVSAGAIGSGLMTVAVRPAPAALAGRIIQGSAGVTIGGGAAMTLRLGGLLVTSAKIKIVAVGVIFLLCLIGGTVAAVHWLMADSSRPNLQLPANPPTARAAPLAFHDSVVDAVTRKPIPNFTIHIGAVYTSQPNEAPHFNDRRPMSFANGLGQFSIAVPVDIPERIGHWCLRFDAPGHLPVTFDLPADWIGGRFSLEPGHDLQGVVLDADGKPAAGATVQVAVPGIDVNIDPGIDKRSDGANTFRTTTGPDGQFSLTPQVGRIMVAATSDSGCAIAAVVAQAAPIVLHLAPFAHVSGRLMIGGKPAADMQVYIGSAVPPDPSGPNVRTEGTSQTDADGRFRFDRVVAGPIDVCRQVLLNSPNGGNFPNETLNEFVTVKAGETATVNVGGRGRPVVGNIVLPPGSRPVGDYSLVAKVIEKSPSTQPSAVRQYAMEIADDGSFRIEDMIPGDYTVKLIQSKPVGSVLNPQSAEFTVPPAPGGRGDEPVVLPDIQMTRKAN
jgi:RNA polymerase sigma factor (sigma-70 family)